jgi:hypothetical protein
MSTSPTSELLAETSFVCDCFEWVRSACAGQPFYREHEGKRYCVLHFPGKEKSADFQKAFQRKIDGNDFNFSGVWFPSEIQFSNFDFTTSVDFPYTTFNAPANFSNAGFNGKANFRGATFRADANFEIANFSAEANFSWATFGGTANFREASFSARAYFFSTSFGADANFQFASFGAGADFQVASFKAEAIFRSATLKSHFAFAGHGHDDVFTDIASLDLQFVRIEKPDHISFHTLTFRPHWFVNVDSRKFEFTNVEWDWRSIEDEVASLKKRFVSAPHRMLAIACRHLAVNAEDNHRYEEASKFRYMAMDARRLEHWRGFDFRGLSWWYWLASGYGERVWRALLVLIAIMLVSAALYTKVGFSRWEPRVGSESDLATAQRDEVGAPLKPARALTYSAAVMTFQRPEPRPATTAAHTVVLLETILGPVQAALLALAIRRKFMR